MIYSKVFNEVAYHFYDESIEMHFAFLKDFG